MPIQMTTSGAVLSAEPLEKVAERSIAAPLKPDSTLLQMDHVTRQKAIDSLTVGRALQQYKYPSTHEHLLGSSTVQHALQEIKNLNKTAHMVEFEKAQKLQQRYEDVLGFSDRISKNIYSTVLGDYDSVVNQVLNKSEEIKTLLDMTTGGSVFNEALRGVENSLRPLDGVLSGTGNSRRQTVNLLNDFGNSRRQLNRLSDALGADAGIRHISQQYRDSLYGMKSMSEALAQLSGLHSQAVSEAVARSRTLYGTDSVSEALARLNGLPGLGSVSEMFARSRTLYGTDSASDAFARVNNPAWFQASEPEPTQIDFEQLEQEDWQQVDLWMSVFYRERASTRTDREAINNSVQLIANNEGADPKFVYAVIKRELQIKAIMSVREFGFQVAFEASAVVPFPELPAAPAAQVEPVQVADVDRLDLAMLATPDELIEAFGRFTGMSESWFLNITDKPGLNAARRIKGARGRGGQKPLFCPLNVMLWLTTGKRKVGGSLSEEKGWSLLESHFSKVYAAHASADPR